MRNLFSLFSESTSPARQGPRYSIAVIVTLVIGTAVSVAVYYLARDREAALTRFSFEQKVQTSVEAIRLSINSAIESTESAGVLFDSNNALTREQFNMFAERALERNSTLMALIWLPFVPGDLRPAFEAEAQLNDPGFEIREFDADSQPVKATKREWYFPIYYSVRSDGAQSFIGLDVASLRKDILTRAFLSGQITASRKIILRTGRSAGEPGYGLYRPVYVNGAHPGTTDWRNLAGFAQAAFDISAQIDMVLKQIRSEGIHITLYDGSTEAEHLLAVWPTDTPPAQLTADAKSLQKQVIIDVAGQQWVAVISPQAGSVDTGSFSVSLALLTTGFFLSLLLAAYLESQRRNALNIQEQAIHDQLTGLYNRRYLKEFVQRELTRAERNQSAVAVVMIDIDYFKRINDTFGHAAGDLVLVTLGNLLTTSVRSSDLACRYGGEELLLILPDTSRGGAMLRAEEIRSEIKHLDINYQGKTLGPITVSMGVALYPDSATDVVSLLRCADEALYEAKGAGRDRVVLYGA